MNDLAAMGILFVLAVLTVAGNALCAVVTTGEQR